jgi:hypothetical protein
VTELKRTGPKRTKFQREQRYVEIARRYLKGETQTEIGATLGLDQSQISLDLKVIQGRWRTQTAHDLDAAKARELARIDELERTYWVEWAESKEEKQIRGTKTVHGESVRTEEQMRKEQRDGNPSYLLGIQWCVEQRCKILGLYAPTTVNLGFVRAEAQRIAAAYGLDVDDVLAEAKRILAGDPA